MHLIRTRKMSLLAADVRFPNDRDAMAARPADLPPDRQGAFFETPDRELASSS